MTEVVFVGVRAEVPKYTYDRADWNVPLTLDVVRARLDHGEVVIEMASPTNDDNE
jgi:hypothetical protein